MKKQLFRSTKIKVIAAACMMTACGLSYASNTSNPFEGATFYVDPTFSSKANTFLKSNDEYRKKADNLNLLNKNTKEWGIATAIWLDEMATIDGKKDLGVYKHLENAYAQAKTANQAVAITFVVYDLPNRDCAALSSNGEMMIPAGESGETELMKYQKEFINPINEAITHFYQNHPEAKNNVRTVLVLEPDSLPNMITNIEGGTSTPMCKAVYAHHIYERGIRYAIETFVNNANHENIDIYLDIAHSGWLGWDNNANKIANFYNEKVLGADFNKIRGFITNTANYTPTQEKGMTYDKYREYNRGIIRNNFYEWNNTYDEASFIGEILSINNNGEITKNGEDHKLKSVFGKYKNMHFLIDTSRNGWKGHQVQDEYKEYYLQQDQRSHRGNWCNSKEAGIGALPQANPSLTNIMYEPKEGAFRELPIDAYVWIKPPGESDGRYDPKTGEGDGMCGNKPLDRVKPDYSVVKNVPTDSLQDGDAPAPKAGYFFERAFKELIDHHGS